MTDDQDGPVWPPPGWPLLHGEPMDDAMLGDLLARRNAWADEVHRLGLDAAPYPLTIEEDLALGEVRRLLRGLQVVLEAEQYLRDQDAES